MGRFPRRAALLTLSFATGLAAPALAQAVAGGGSPTARSTPSGRSATTTLVSLDLGGNPAVWGANGASISADGRWIGFTSGSPYLVEGMPLSSFSQTFVQDRLSGVNELVSVDPTGASADGASEGAPALSGDGRWVVFESTATSLVPGDGNGQRDVFLRDRLTGVTTRVSVATGGGESNGLSWGGRVSRDGRFVAFASMATNLVTADTNLKQDVFVRDVLAGTTARVSVSSSGVQANDVSSAAALTADGSQVVFASLATNLLDGGPTSYYNVFARERATGETRLISATNQGTEPGGHSFGPPAVSPDGRFIAFSSLAPDLSDEDGDPFGDVFVRDTLLGTTSLVSRAPSGPAAGDSFFPSLSDDGLSIAFLSLAANLVPDDDNFCPDVFLHDLRTSRTSCLSVTPSGEVGDNASGGNGPELTASGRFCVFDSYASDLVPQSLPGSSQSYLRGPLR